MAIKFGHLERFVADPPQAARFYVDVLGFDHVADQGADNQWVALGNVELLLRRGAPPAPGPRYAEAAGGLVIYTDDVPSLVARLTDRGVAMRGDDGPTNPTFTDPDGHWFQLANPG